MEVVHEKCAGIDVHKKTAAVCVITPGRKEVGTFGPMTRQLFEMIVWLTELSVTSCGTSLPNSGKSRNINVTAVA